jgi:NADH-quinone oxidoreductase subunit L
LVVTLPLILLAIPSVIIGFYTITPLLFGTYFGDSIFIDIARHPVMKELEDEFHGPIAMALHAFTSPVLLLLILGVLTAAIAYLWAPKLPGVVAQAFAPVKKLLDHKYYLDELNQLVFAKGLLWIGNVLWQRGDQKIIDGFIVDGTAYSVGRFAGVIRHLQSGYLYHYAFAMIAGLAVLLAWVLYAYLPFVR